MCYFIKYGVFKKLLPIFFVKQGICDLSKTFFCPGTLPESSKDCINRDFICDGLPDCLDQADETDCSLGGGPTNGIFLFNLIFLVLF